MIPTPAAARDTIMDFRGLVGGSALASFRHAKMHALGMMTGDTDEEVAHVATAIAVSAGRGDLADALTICLAIKNPTLGIPADPVTAPLEPLLNSVFTAVQSLLDAFESRELTAFDTRCQAAKDGGVWNGNVSQVGNLIHFIASAPTAPTTVEPDLG